MNFTKTELGGKIQLAKTPSGWYQNKKVGLCIHISCAWCSLLRIWELPPFVPMARILLFFCLPTSIPVAFCTCLLLCWLPFGSHALEFGHVVTKSNGCVYPLERLHYTSTVHTNTKHTHTHSDTRSLTELLLVNEYMIWCLVLWTRSASDPCSFHKRSLLGSEGRWWLRVQSLLRKWFWGCNSPHSWQQICHCFRGQWCHVTLFS